MEALKAILLKLNQKGIIIPLLYDNNRKRGSVTLTMYWISYQLCLIGLIGKWAKLLDLQYSDCIWLLAVSGGFYLGRSVSSDKHGNVDVGGGEEKRRDYDDASTPTESSSGEPTG